MLEQSRNLQTYLLACKKHKVVTGLSSFRRLVVLLLPRFPFTFLSGALFFYISWILSFCFFLSLGWLTSRKSSDSARERIKEINYKWKVGEGGIFSCLASSFSLMESAEAEQSGACNTWGRLCFLSSLWKGASERAGEVNRLPTCLERAEKLLQVLISQSLPTKRREGRRFLLFFCEGEKKIMENERGMGRICFFSCSSRDWC